jgi:phenylalanyl-tRNA synthetase beta chain
VLIESALWDPANIAHSGRKLGIVTDARYRFERGVDPEFCAPGAELATKLTLDFCGGEASHLVIAGNPAHTPRPLDFLYGEVKRLTGLDIAQSEGEAILRKLGFTLSPGKATPPTWRPDITGKADVVEQIIRIAGLERVAAQPLERLEAGPPRPVLTLLQRRTRLAKRSLAALGLREAVTWSFIARARAELFGGGSPALALANPIAADLSDMRPSLIPGLAAAADRNARRGLRDIAMFEVGQVFLGDSESDQRVAAASIRRGMAKATGSGRNWVGGAGPVDLFDAKSDAMTLLAALGISLNAVQLVPGGPAFLHPGRSATLRRGPRNIVGWFGQLHPDAVEALDVEGPIVGFEIVLDELPPPKARATRARPRLERFELMPVERDLAFLAAKDVRAGDIVKAALGADRALVVSADVFDIYEGPGVASGYKSVAISVTLQPRTQTLTDADIDAVMAKIIGEVARKTSSTLRA